MFFPPSFRHPPAPFSPVRAMVGEGFRSICEVLIPAALPAPPYECPSKDARARFRWLAPLPLSMRRRGGYCSGAQWC